MFLKLIPFILKYKNSILYNPLKNQYLFCSVKIIIHVKKLKLINKSLHHNRKQQKKKLIFVILFSLSSAGNNKSPAKQRSNK